MVAAIVIPIIILYFYFITKKDMKEHDRKWLETGQIVQEAVLSGKIKNQTESKQRFYYNRYIYVQEMQLQTETKLITVKKITPLTKNAEILPFQLGERIRIYGRWVDKQFYFNRYELIKNAEVPV